MAAPPRVATAREQPPARSPAGCCATSAGARRPPTTARAAPPVPLVAGDVPDGGGLLLHPGLPAGDRLPRRRPPGPGGDAGAGAADPVRGPAGLPPGGRGEPPRRGLDRHAGAAPPLVGGASSSCSSCWASWPPTSSSPSPSPPPTPRRTSWRTPSPRRRCTGSRCRPRCSWWPSWAHHANPLLLGSRAVPRSLSPHPTRGRVPAASTILRTRPHPRRRQPWPRTVHRPRHRHRHRPRRHAHRERAAAGWPLDEIHVPLRPSAMPRSAASETLERPASGRRTRRSGWPRRRQPIRHRQRRPGNPPPPPAGRAHAHPSGRPLPHGSRTARPPYHQVDS